MARKSKCWRWSAGSYGNTVIVFERRPGGSLYLGVPRGGEQGGYVMMSLGHTDRDAAMQQAMETAAKRQAGEGRKGPLTVGAMFGLYLRSVQGVQCHRHNLDVQRATEMWCRHLGSDFKVERFCLTDWETFTKLRASGELDANGHIVTDPEKREPVGPRTVARDLKVFRAACRRATAERTPSHDFLLAADPTRGLAVPVERNPKRPVCDSDRFDALMAVADQVQMRPGIGRDQHWEPSYLRTLLRLGGDCGRRISSIRALRWSDWHPEMGKHGKLFWRAESDKVKRDWYSPVTLEVRQELERFRRERPALGNALMFPAPNNQDRPVSYKVVLDWLRRAEALAGLDPLPRGAYHALRRGWATARKHLPLTDLAAVGGWVDTVTLSRCYCQTDEETQEQVISSPRRIQRMG